MIDEKKKKRIGELRDSGLSIKEVAKTLEISESSVKRHSSYTPDLDDEIDKRTADAMVKIMSVEGYDFDDEIMPIVYKARNIANEIDITLHDYLNDISSSMSKFLRLTEKPERFFYVFCEMSKNLSVITDHIEAEDLINAIDNFYNREIAMEEAEDYIADIEVKAELALNNTKQIWDENQKRIGSAKRKARNEIELKSDELLENAKAELKEYQDKIEKAKQESEVIITYQTRIIEHIEKLESENQKLKQTLEQTNKEKEFLGESFKKIGAKYPEEAKMVIEESLNEQKAQLEQT